MRKMITLGVVILVASGLLARSSDDAEIASFVNEQAEIEAELLELVQARKLMKLSSSEERVAVYEDWFIANARRLSEHLENAERIFGKTLPSNKDSACGIRNTDYLFLKLRQQSLHQI